MAVQHGSRGVPGRAEQVEDIIAQRAGLCYKEYNRREVRSASTCLEPPAIWLPVMHRPSATQIRPRTMRLAPAAQSGASRYVVPTGVGSGAQMRVFIRIYGSSRPRAAFLVLAAFGACRLSPLRRRLLLGVRLAVLALVVAGLVRLSLTQISQRQRGVLAEPVAQCRYVARSPRFVRTSASTNI